MSRSTGRRVSRTSGADTFNCSRQSILSAMDRFVKSVNNMDATVLVPSRLRDMDTITGNKIDRIPAPLAETDLYSFYTMINDVKNQLLWGPGTGVTAMQSSMSAALTRPAKNVGQSSEDSLGSISSTASSSDPDTDSEGDSMTTDNSADERTYLAAAFRHHLQGLHTILSQLGDSADYLSSRYQEDVDAVSY